MADTPIQMNEDACLHLEITVVILDWLLMITVGLSPLSFSARHFCPMKLFQTQEFEQQYTGGCSEHCVLEGLPSVEMP